MMLRGSSFCSRCSGRRTQRGQALVFALFASILVILALFAMYSLGSQSIEKVRLQNTADAAAYSASLAEARDYNFAAYTNRAMIANQVAVAQFVGLTSWLRNLSLYTNNKLLQGLLSAGSSPIGKIYKGFLKIAGKLFGVFDEGKGGSTFMQYVVTSLDALTTTYSTSQKIYHYSTALTVAQTLGVINTVGDALGIDSLTDFDSDDNIIALNDPNARLTGTVGLAYLFKHYYDFYQFTDFKDPNTDKKDGDDADRFAKVTKASLDGFSLNRSTGTYTLFPFGLTLLDPGTFFPYVNGLAYLPVHHRGGTELKLTKNASDDLIQKKNWTALDANGVSGTGIFIIWITIPIFLVPVPIPIPIPLPPHYTPLSAGAAYAGPPKKDFEDASDPDNNFDTAEATDAYGSAFGWTSPTLVAAWAQKATNHGNTKSLSLFPGLSGLTKYMDVRKVDSETDNLTGPTLVIEIEKNISDMASNPASGRFATENGAPKTTSNDERTMRSLSKSEVFFSRPSDLFSRDDSKTELGSLYNPYWQARLLPNNFLEQYLSMELHRTGWR